MQNTYEIIYITKPSITESQVIKTINYYKRFLKRNGAHNILIQHRGRRHLSYNINNYYDGIYIQMNFNGNALLISSLEKFIKLDDNILRYLTIKQNTRKNSEDPYN